MTNQPEIEEEFNATSAPEGAPKWLQTMFKDELGEDDDNS